MDFSETIIIRTYCSFRPSMNKLFGDFSLFTDPTHFFAKSLLNHNCFLLNRYTSNLVPRSVYTSGKSSSAAGLTATVAKEPETGEFCIEVILFMLLFCII